MPVLHQMQVSGNCYKVRLAARQLGLAITLKNYGLHDGTTRQPHYLVIAPLTVDSTSTPIRRSVPG